MHFLAFQIIHFIQQVMFNYFISILGVKTQLENKKQGNPYPTVALYRK